MLDILIAILLLAVLPARGIWNSRNTRTDDPSRAQRYLTTMSIVGVLLVLLAVDWLLTGRSAAMLGLGIPVTVPAMLGLAATGILLGIMSLAVRRKIVSGDMNDQKAGTDILSESAGEVRLFMLFALMVGFGWEVLYRGFLLLYLPAHIGWPGAIMAAALAYGLAHGIKTRPQAAASIVAAFAFTIGYVLTRNLWWLIILHVALPLIGLAAKRYRGEDLS
ncbi:CPBP family intramembrane glutamic endopeptidase [Novosphingopyxis sp.]|uniref:CPBP family intramembrane glutamic endopeptidase n=1 Tax=Novosphingopyxis sp. TaxID=2709690 RepID=UPI003B5C7634